MSDWPSELAWRLLDELESDPTDAGCIELGRLLDAWGATNPLSGEDMRGYVSRVHPRLPGFVFHYPHRAELSPATIRSICSAVRELHRRLSHD